MNDSDRQQALDLNHVANSFREAAFDDVPHVMCAL